MDIDKHRIVNELWFQKDLAQIERDYWATIVERTTEPPESETAIRYRNNLRRWNIATKELARLATEYAK